MCIFAVRLPFFAARLIFLFTFFSFTRFRKFQSQATTTRCEKIVLFLLSLSCCVWLRLLWDRIYSMHKYSFEQKEEKRHFYGIHYFSWSIQIKWISLCVRVCVCVPFSPSVFPVVHFIHSLIHSLCRLSHCVSLCAKQSFYISYNFSHRSISIIVLVRLYSCIRAFFFCLPHNKVTLIQTMYFDIVWGRKITCIL